MKVYDCPNCDGVMNANSFQNIFLCDSCRLVIEEEALKIIARLIAERDTAILNLETDFEKKEGK